MIKNYSSLTDLSDIDTYGMIGTSHFIGIDPGRASGGICILDSNGNISKLDSFKNLSDDEIVDVFSTLVLFKTFGSVQCVVENVHAMGTNGSVANFSMGWSAGTINFGMRKSRINTVYASPRKWQKTFTHKKKGDFASDTKWKGHLYDIAKLKVPGTYPKYIGDAVLIAYYCKSINQI